MGILDGPNNRILKADTKVQDALEALADHVDHQRKTAILFHGQSYKAPNPHEIQTVRVDGVTFGYRLEDHRIYMRRVVFMKVPGYKISDISEDERSRIMTALFNVFFLPGGKPPVSKLIAPDCLFFEHDFVPEIAVERNPGLVSIVGGFGGKENA